MAMEHIHSEEVGLIDELCEKFHKVLAKFLRKVFYVARIFESDPIWDAWVNFVWEFQTKPADDLSMNV